VLRCATQGIDSARELRELLIAGLRNWEDGVNNIRFTDSARN
jgi:hypothetical protein